MKIPKNRNPVARDLHSAKYAPKVVRKKTPSRQEDKKSLRREASKEHEHGNSD